MGGARCSYKNCSQRSDKKTHMFHYPVFDKMRCHQWISNAQKLSYLNLKLSQLKNRMICQHHFRDDCFMNVMKQKLKCDAIPTEDGPFCSKPFIEEDIAQGNGEPDFAINIEYIEDEFMPTTDRKAHLSVKYGDFLTNEVSDSITLTPDYKSTSILLQDKGLIFNRFDRNTRSTQYIQMPHNNVKRNVKVTRSTVSKERLDDPCKLENKLPEPKVVAIDFDELNLNATSTTQNQNSGKDEKVLTSSVSIPHSKKVRIISEKHLSEPVKITASELQPVSPSIVIKVPDKKKRSNIEVDDHEIKPYYVDNINNFHLRKGLPENDSSMISFAQLPMMPTEQVDLTSYSNPTMCIDQIGLDNMSIQNADSIKPLDHLHSETNLSGQQLEQHSNLFTDIDNMSLAPKLELVSGSLTGPSIYTLTDVPQVSTRYQKPSVINSSFAYVESVPRAQNQESEMPVVNQDSTVLINNMLQTSNTVQSTASKKLTSKTVSPTKSMAKYKMPPEKLAAIEEKRKYNMKLRDILNSCLNNMDEEPDIGKLTGAMKKEMNSKKVGEYLTKDSGQPGSQENIIEYFETRLQRMEDNLLNRIEQNSQKIIDLKQMVKKQIPSKKATSTQTYFSSEATKRVLYEQMSQYLTPDTNSLIYEELFINQCLTKTVPKKRKKRNQNNGKEI